MSLLLLVILILVLLAVLPSWPYSRGWGYFPSGIVGVIVVIILILWLLGKLCGTAGGWRDPTRSTSRRAWGCSGA